MEASQEWGAINNNHLNDNHKDPIEKTNRRNTFVHTGTVSL